MSSWPWLIQGFAQFNLFAVKPKNGKSTLTTSCLQVVLPVRHRACGWQPMTIWLTPIVKIQSQGSPHELPELLVEAAKRPWTPFSLKNVLAQKHFLIPRLGNTIEAHLEGIMVTLGQFRILKLSTPVILPQWLNIKISETPWAMPISTSAISPSMVLLPSTHPQ